MAYRVLIIGCGAIAGGYDAERSLDDWPLSHAGAIARNERFELAACVDPDDTARAAFAARWGVPTNTASLEKLDAAPGDYELIVIASPTTHHAEHLEWALSMQPKAVFCEKPLAKDYDQIAPIERAFRDAGIALAVNYTRRWAPDINALVEGVRNDDWGELLSAAGTYSKGVVHNGTHMVDLMMMFAGPLAVQSVGPAVADFWEDDPTVSAILTAVNSGAPLHLVAGDSEWITQFELVLSYQFGEIAIRDGGMRIETRDVGDSATVAGYRQLGLPQSVPGRYAQAMSLAYEDMARVITSKGKSVPAWSEKNGFAAHAICEEIRLTALESLKKDSE
ncbi:MAG: Gfo/Idh/MocA family oxidoreductase [Pseudomonadota bacterium]